MDQSHMHALEAKHAELDRKLENEQLRPLPDNFLIADIKKQKLRLKEEMSFH